MFDRKLHRAIFATTFLILINSVCGVKKAIPSYIKLCRRNGETLLKQCLEENVEIVRPYLTKGIPEMRIPIADPLNIQEVSLNLNNFHAAFYNSSVYECSKFILKSLDVDLTKNYLNLKINLPKVRLEGDYEISGKLVILDLKGSGKYSINISNVDAFAEMFGVREERNGKVYLNMNDNKLKMKAGGAKLHFSRLFGDNEELTEATNKIVNENIHDFMKDLSPIIQETVAQFLFTIISQVFDNFSIDELFPKD